MTYHLHVRDPEKGNTTQLARSSYFRRKVGCPGWDLNSHMLSGLLYFQRSAGGGDWQIQRHNEQTVDDIIQRSKVKTDTCTVFI